MAITAMERSNNLTKNDGFMTQRGAEFLEDVTTQVNKSTITTGNGSPEGVIPGTPGETYMDQTGSSGNIFYIKQTGSGKSGWILA